MKLSRKPFLVKIPGNQSKVGPDDSETEHFMLKFQETKAKLVQTTQKLKEAKEEGEQIRADCQAMIKQYQVSFSETVLNSILELVYKFRDKIKKKRKNLIHVFKSGTELNKTSVLYHINRYCYCLLYEIFYSKTDLFYLLYPLETFNSLPKMTYKTH